MRATLPTDIGAPDDRFPGASHTDNGVENDRFPYLVSTVVGAT
jgi:hypothetical protein